MDLKGVKFDAFISYRHSPVDMYIAKSIHRRLENFKLPPEAVEKVIEKGKKAKIERVFRDQDELPLADNLSDPIDVALTNSEFLIVICTPRLPLSKWCRKEITTFIQKHDRDHVLAVLAEGEPDESFPYELTHEILTISSANPETTGETTPTANPETTGETTPTANSETTGETAPSANPEATGEINPTANSKTIIRELEPLAADVRGKTRRETEKMLDDAVVRLAAAIFDLNYDDLKQRHKEQQNKRKMKILGGIASALLIFSMVCLALLLTINSQKRTINSQYDEISDQYNQIEDQYCQIQDQYVQIEDQYNEIQDKYEDAMGNSASSLLDAGRRNDALYALLSASGSEDCKAGTEYLLSKALNVYGLGDHRAPTLTYDIASNVEDMALNSDGSLLALKGADGCLTVFDTKTGEKVYEIQTSDTPYQFNSFQEEAFASDNVIYYIDLDGLSLYDVEKQKTKLVMGCPEMIFGNQELGLVFAQLGDVIHAFDTEGNERYRVDTSFLGEEIDSNMVYLENYAISPDGRKVAVQFSLNDGDCLYLIFNAADGNVLSCLQTRDRDLTSMALSDDAIYIMEADGVTAQTTTVTTVSARDIYSMDMLWNGDIYGKYYTKLAVGYGQFLAYSSGNALLMDTVEGEILNSWSELPDIITASWMNEEEIWVSCADGEVYSLNRDREYYLPMSSYLYSYGPAERIMDIQSRDEDLYLLFSGEKYISKYSPAHCETSYPDFEAPQEYLDYSHTFGTLIELEDGRSKKAFVSPDNKYTFSRQYDGTVIVYDTAGEKKASIYDFETELSDVMYIEELNRYMLKGYSGSFLLDEDFQIVAKLPSCYGYEEGYFIVRNDGEWYRMPYLETQDLMNKADEVLGDYVPSEEITVKYGIRTEK